MRSGADIRLLCLLAALAAGPLAPTPRAHKPHDVTNVIALSPDFGKDRTIITAVRLTELDLLARSFDGGATWVHTGPPMVLNGVQALAISPDFARDGTLFAATETGGLYRSRDRGETWTLLDTGLAGSSANDLSLSPDFAQDGTLLAATHAGLLISTDAGESWGPAGEGLGESEIHVVRHAPGGVLFAGTTVLHRSDDGGRHWQPLSGMPLPLASLAVGATPADPLVLAASFGQPGGGVWVSLDGGLSFAPALDGLTDLRVNEVALAGDGTLFAATWHDGCFTTAAPFAPWEASPIGLDPLSDQSDNHYRAVAPSPDFALDRTVVLGSFEGCYLSEDGGKTWDQLELYPLRVNRLLSVSPDFAADGAVFVGSYGGGVLAHDPLHPPDDGRTGAPQVPPTEGAPPPFWEPRSNGLVPWSGALALSPSFAEDHTMFYGYSRVWRSLDRGRTWFEKTKPPINIVRTWFLSDAYAEDKTLFLGAGIGGIFRSSDGAGSWTALVNGLPDDIRATEFAGSPTFAADGTLFLGTIDTGLFRTWNQGFSWVELGFPDAEVRAVAVSPSFPVDRTVFVAVTGQGVLRSTDAGASWEPVNAGLGAPGEPAPAIVQDLALSPDFAADRTLFAAPFGGGVFRSQDAGESWQPADAGLPVDTPRTLALSPEFRRDRTLFTTNHDWVWTSTDAGANWTRLPAMVRVDDDHQSVRYSGPWAQANSVGHSDFGYAVHASQQAGDETRLDFVGDSVTWFAQRGPAAGGIAEIRIDGELRGYVPLWAPTVESQVPAFSMEFERLGAHTIEVINSGHYHPQSLGPKIRSDGFAFTF